MKTVITANKKIGVNDLKELWEYRDLLLILSWRDIKVKYKQTALGVAWVVLQPLITMILFSFFFGKLAKIPSGELPYHVFVLAGLVFWNYFSNSLNHASNCLIEHENMIKKIFFPRILLPFSSLLTNLVDFCVNFVLLILVVLLAGIKLNIFLLLIVPALLLITAMTALGSGLFLSALNVKYRDVRYALPFLFQILIYITPVIYPLSIVSPTNQSILALNPMTSVVELFREVILGSIHYNLVLLIISLSSSLTILTLGVWFFKRTERFFADIA